MFGDGYLSVKDLCTLTDTTYLRFFPFSQGAESSILSGTRMKSERLGMVVIVSSLLVITLIIGLFFVQQRESRITQIRAQGTSLVRLLTRMSYEQLVSTDSQQGLLYFIRSSQDNPNFAYGTLVDPRGQPLVEVTAPGAIVPFAAIAPEPSSWFGERLINDPTGEGSYREFISPLMSDGERIAHVRIGYSEPDYLYGQQQVSFFATLALPIFLLATLFYLLLRREINPLKQASAQICGMLNDNPIRKVELKATGEIGEFVRHFNRMIQLAEKRIEDLEGQQEGMTTSTKVLSYQKARVETVLESMPEAVIVMDEVGAVTFANQKLESLIGVDHHTILGREPHEWCKNAELLEFMANYKGNMPRRNASGTLELVPDHAPDKRISVNAYPLFSPRDDARVYGTLIVLHDVTMETLAKRARSEFVAHLAHELKTPLHVIGMYGEMLLSEDGSPEENRIEAANVINDEVERVATLIRNMLSITKIEMGSISLDRQRIKLSDLLKDAFNTAARGADSMELKFISELPKELSAVYIDKDLFRIAINNLLSNAIKYNNPGGTVTVGAEESDDRIVINVRDTGLGIKPEDRLRVFDKFYRSEDTAVRDVTGHGLGLALVKDVVELHHGEIHVQSAPGEGAEFSILLKKTPALLRQVV